MAVNDIILYKAPVFGDTGSKQCNVAAGATTINPGEPVARALGATSVTAAATNSPQVGTHYFEGIATSTSTQTASAAGKVFVQPLIPGAIYVIKPKVAATWDTQAEYGDLVGKRVLIDLTSSTYTLLAADSAGNGCVVEPLNIKEYPGSIAFSFRNGVSVLS